MRFLFTIFFTFYIFNILSAQTTLPLTRTIWNSASTGWTDNGTSSYTTSFACSGSNMGQLNDTGDSYTVFFNSAPQTLIFTFKVTSVSTNSCLIEESSNGSTWTTIENVTPLPTLCTMYTYSLLNTTRYVKWTYTKNSGNLGLDDVSISAAPLPIKIKSFNVSAINNISSLKLITASETNNDYFTIERSSDGISFDAIGEIKGAGNSSSELKYEFVDENPLPGINYYRIKQTDFDGKYSFTEIKSIRHQLGQITVSPHRTDGRLQITSTQDNYDVVMYSTAGQEVYRMKGLSGDQTLSIESLEAGIYIVKILEQTFKIVKY